MKILSLEINNFLNNKRGKINFVGYPLVVNDYDNMSKKYAILSIMIFLRGCRLLLENTCSKGMELFTTVDDLLDIYLNEQYNISSFLRYKNKNNISCFVGEILTDGHVDKIHVFLNNNIISVNSYYEKIENFGYVYMYNIYPYYNVMNISENNNNLRSVFVTLDESYKNCIKNHMRDIFCTNNIIYGINKCLYINIQYDSEELEIMYSDCHIQKVFASFTLLYKIISDKYSNSYYIIDEPEVFLEHYKMIKYHSALKYICDKNNVNLIIITNNNYIQFNTYNIFSIKNNNVKTISNNINININTNIFENLLLVEGSTEIYENGFLTKLANVYPVLKKFFMMEKNRINEKYVSKNNINCCYKKTISLVDKDFLPYELSRSHNEKMEEDGFGVYKIYTDLPCSESYLILDYIYISSRKNVHEKLQDYFSNNRNKIDYINGYNTATSKYPGYEGKGEENWNRALSEISKDNPDYILIVSVIRGHNWVEMLKGGKYPDSIISSSKNWYKKKDFTDFHPIVQIFLDRTYGPSGYFVRVCQ